MAGDVLLPAAGARLAPTTFDAWLAEVRAMSTGRQVRLASC
jgi:hypothetical protein